MDAFINSMRFNFLYVDKYSFGTTWVYPESQLPYSMLRYITDGKGEFCLNDEKIIIEKDQIVYLPEGSKLACKALEDNFSFISIRFTTSVFYQGADFLSEYYQVPRITKGNEMIKNLFLESYRWIMSKSDARMFFVRGNLELIIANLIESSKNNTYSHVHKQIKEKSLNYDLEEIKRREQKLNIKEDPRIRVVIDYMVMHPTEQYTTKKLSEMADVAETTFRRLFKQQTGKAPKDFLKEIRLTTAARKLLVSNAAISDIAYELGFEDPNYFIRVFRKAFGMTPNQYRKIAIE